jgi:hypothetical protein
MLRHRLYIGPLATALAQGTPDGVDRLRDIPLFDQDTGPHRRQDHVPGDERAAVSDEMNQRLERLFGDDDAFALRAVLERPLADVELELSEVIDFDGRVRRPHENARVLPHQNLLDASA